MSGRVSLVVGLPLLAALTSCATPRCGAAPAGATLRWDDLDPAVPHPIVLLPVTEQAPAAGDASRRPVVMRFDVAALPEGTTIDRAALLLAPSPTAPRDRCVLLRVRAVDESWSPQAVARGDVPALSGDGAAEVTLPPYRAPVRVDVTAIARALGPVGLATRGIALTATEGGAAFRGSGTLAPEERPRLEVLLR